ncbi:GMP synthase-like glutamine amidotransferase [Dongia mobilis]|uniref:GMP synthase-like glutamine amidotransferase n=1 Tax=Dongia mobilis TaxID=578943 RepID=A0A4R6WMB7_9PROT|nr:type 1 glutamine amidotransferase [Dongia mobilis]TDQ82122.1 GMP synthase-like glutamine amidotransferase [Dongia mobilis]
MRFLVFQHIACEHPGIFRDFLAADGIAYDAVELDAGETIPPLENYDALWVMGGPMDVWEEDIHPWLTAEKAAIREAVWQRKMPYFGLCLGHQLLACSLDGAVGKMRQAEVGILDVALTEAGKADSIMAGLAPKQQALQWHGAEVTKLPREAVVLASSPLCEVQAMRVGSHAYGLQYHVELTARTVAEWGEVPAYAQSLDAVMGPGSLPRLEKQAAALMPQFNAAAKRLYENFMQATLRGARAAQ